MSGLGWVGIVLASIATIGWGWLIREAWRDTRAQYRAREAAWAEVFAEFDAIDREGQP